MSGIVGSHLRLYTIALYRVSVTRDERAPPHLTVRVARASFKFQIHEHVSIDPWRVAPCERTVVMSLHSYCMALLFDICAYASWYAYNLESEIRKVEAHPPRRPLMYVYTATGRCNQLSQWKCLPQGMPLTATHAPLLTLHMLWVDLSKCFMTFSRAVGQLLQARRGVPAQVR